MAFNNQNTLSIYSLQNKRDLVSSKDIEEHVGQAEFAPSGDFIAVVVQKSIKLFDLNLRPIRKVEFEDLIFSLRITKHDDVLVIGTQKGNVIIFDHKNFRDQIVLNIHRTAVTTIILNEDDSIIYSMESEQKRKISTTQFPKLALMKKLPNSMIIGFSPHNRLFLKTKDGLKLLDIKNDQESHISSAEGINTVLCAEQKIIISQLSQILVINSQTKESSSMIDPDFDIPMTLISDKTGNKLFTGSKQKIKIWDLENMQVTANWKAHEDIVSCFLLVKEETKLISGSYDNLIKIWDANTTHLISTLKGHQGDINSFQITKDEKYLISSSSDKTIRIWNWELEMLVVTINGTASITGLHLTDDEKFLISSSMDGRITY